MLLIPTLAAAGDAMEIQGLKLSTVLVCGRDVVHTNVGKTVRITVNG